jgi:hypothetical protein
MRKVLIAIAAVAVTVIGVSVASVASGSSTPTEGSGPVLFQDYFNSPTDPNWRSITRTDV